MQRRLSLNNIGIYLNSADPSIFGEGKGDEAIQKQGFRDAPIRFA
jgi:hypothetical protein